MNQFRSAYFAVSLSFVWFGFGCSGTDLDQDKPSEKITSERLDMGLLSDPSDELDDQGLEEREGEEDQSHSSETSNASSDQSAFAFTHKMVKETGESLFSSLAYECPECTFEQWESIVPPEGWKKGPAQIGLFSAQDSEMRSYPSAEGHPHAVDFLEEVPGEEYKLIAINVDGRLIERGPNGIVAEVKVQRDTRLVFNIGMRVHELTNPEGHLFVLFAHQVDPERWQEADFQSMDSLGEFAPPTGWTYSTRLLEEELVLDSNRSNGIVTVLALRGTKISTWEKYE